MSNKIEEKIREVYEYLLRKNRELLVKEGIIAPSCYAITFDPKNNIGVMPIPLIDSNTPEDRRALMVEMSKIFKKEKIKVKMFMFITEAWMRKIDKENQNAGNLDGPSLQNDPEKEEGLLCSARDCYDNVKFQVFKITRDDRKKITLREETKGDTVREWTKINKEKQMPYRDTLLDSFWGEYRKVK